MGGSIYLSCSRVVPEEWYDTGSSLATVPSDRFTILDSVDWSYVKNTGEFYYFEKPSATAQFPEKGDYVVYSNHMIDICGQLLGFQQDGEFEILEILSVPINSFFSFFAFTDTIMTLGNGYKEELDSLVLFRNDTLVIENVDIDVKDNSFVRGVISIDKLSIYELGIGEQFFFMSPEWENGTKTSDAQIEWDQDLSIQGKLSYKANDKSVFKDSLLIRKRSYRKLTAEFPVETIIEEWLVLEWHFPGTDHFEMQFEIEGKSDFSARYQPIGGWVLNSNTDLNSSIFNLNGWDQLKSGYVNLEFNTIITPVFGGLSDTHVQKKLQLNIVAEADWPNWTIDGKVLHLNSLNSFSEILSDIPVGQFDTEKFLKDVLLQTGELENEAPHADFTISPSVGFTNTIFKLNGRSSSDLEDDLNDLLVRWDFDGDAVWDTGFSSDKLETQYYPIPDTYNIIMEVKDTQGAVSSITKQLEVHETTSAPIASFTVSPESGKQADLFTFDASGCHDAEDPITVLEVRWDFQSDGLWDTHYSTTKAQGWFFREPGTYDVVLQVRDSDGLSSSTTKRVTVEPGNIKPTAFFTVNPESGTTETTFIFDANGSSDPEDQIEDLLVRWDFENDGIWDTELRTIKTITHQFPAAGAYMVVLEVHDSEGFSNTFSEQISVSNPNTKPIADFTVSPGSGNSTTKFIFDASISSDLEDDLSQLEVRWDFNYNDNVFDTEFTTVKTASTQYSQPGTYLVKVEIRDSGGLLATRVKLVVVVE